MRQHEKPYKAETATCGGCAELERFQASIQDAVQQTPSQYRGLKIKLTPMGKE